MKRTRRKSNDHDDNPRKKRKINKENQIQDIEDICLKEKGNENWTELELSNIRNNLLKWYDSKESREMPWRVSLEEWENQKKEVSEDKLQEIITQRAYEVWVSEVMLQQTR